MRVRVCVWCLDSIWDSRRCDWCHQGPALGSQSSRTKDSQAWQCPSCKATKWATKHSKSPSPSRDRALWRCNAAKRRRRRQQQQRQRQRRARRGLCGAPVWARPGGGKSRLGAAEGKKGGVARRILGRTAVRWRHVIASWYTPPEGGGVRGSTVRGRSG